MDEEVIDWLRRLVAHFDVENGYPSTYLHTPDGVQHGPVNDELGLLVEEAMELLDEYDSPIEFEMLGDSDE